MPLKYSGYFVLLSWVNKKKSEIFVTVINTCTITNLIKGVKGFWNMETKGNKKIQNWYKRGLKIVMLDEREKSENVENMRDKKLGI